jgi:UDP-galactopyranose mutase
MTPIKFVSTAIENVALQFSDVVKIGRTPEEFVQLDYLVVGAGFAGTVLAERLARGSNKKVLIVDRRNHIGGNAYDHYDNAGVLTHRYGPHIFHTNSREIFDYLSRFTFWRSYEHRVLASVDGQVVPIPINLDTINKLYGTRLNADEVATFVASRAEKRPKIKTSEDVVVSKVGRELYEKFFRGYTRKQWGLDPSELDASVTARVPTRTNRDGRYPNEHAFTRITEMKYLTGQEHPKTSIVYEFPQAEGEPVLPGPAS